MERNSLSPADIAALSGNNDSFGNNGAWWLILFMMFAFGGNGWGNGWGNNGWNNLNNDINNRFLERDVFATNQNVSNTGAFTNQNVSTSACQTQRDVLENRYTNQLGVQQVIANDNNCCMQTQNQILNSKYDLDKEILQNRYENSLQTQTLSGQLAQCCCDIKNTAHQEGEATRALITQNMIDNLRDQLAATREQLTNARSANLANSIIADNAAQTQTLISSLLPRPVPAYPSASPYMAYNWSNYFNNGGCPYNNI